MIFGTNTIRDILNLIVSNFTRLTVRKISYNNFEISLVVSSLCQISLQIMQIRFELVIEISLVVSSLCQISLQIMQIRFELVIEV